MGIALAMDAVGGAAVEGLGWTARALPRLGPMLREAALAPMWMAMGAGGVGGGMPFSGTAYEVKHVAKHIEGTAAAAKLIRTEGAAHVFPDMATLERVENAVFRLGQHTGPIVRGSTTTERFGLWFINPWSDEPIGYRITADGSRKALYYVEAKVSGSGWYHVMPRTGPAQ